MAVNPSIWIVIETTMLIHKTATITQCLVRLERGQAGGSSYWELPASQALVATTFTKAGGPTFITQKPLNSATASTGSCCPTGFLGMSRSSSADLLASKLSVGGTTTTVTQHLPRLLMATSYYLMVRSSLLSTPSVNP
jgi:hypothetical protein